MNSLRGRELLSYLPSYYEASRVMRSDMDAKGSELDALYEALNAAADQFFVRTATWGLDRWEAELGIPTDRSKPIAQRRAVIESKLRGAGNFSGRLVKSVAEAYDGGTVDVTFQPEEWSFTVRFVDTLGIGFEGSARGDQAGSYVGGVCVQILAYSRGSRCHDTG